MRVITGRWKGHPIRAPSGRKVRPTSDRVKEAWMSMLGERLQGARVVDLFAGSGSLGIECLSRGAGSVVFVERSGKVLEVLRSNLDRFDLEEEEARVVRGDVWRFLADLDEDSPPFDIALADPPYGEGLARRLLERFRETPYALELWVEHATRKALPVLGGMESRRYGDTTLTRITAPTPSVDSV